MTPPTTLASASPALALVTNYAAQVEWATKMADEHIDMYTDASILSDMARAVGLVVADLESSLPAKIRDHATFVDARKTGRRLRNVLQIESMMHARKEEPSFNLTQLSEAYATPIRAFERFRDELQDLKAMLSKKSGLS